MSNFNQRGSMGEGAMTGRKMGSCTNMGAGRRSQTREENENTGSPINDIPQGQGMGRGRGRGMGRGMKNGMGHGQGQGGGMGQGRGVGRNRGDRGMGQGIGGGGRGMDRRLPDDSQK